MFDSEAGCVRDADQPRQLGVLLPGHQLGQHVAHAENVRERDLKMIHWLVAVEIKLFTKPCQDPSVPV